MPIINCHTHAFTTKVVPNKFLPFVGRLFKPLLSKHNHAKRIEWLAKLFGDDARSLIRKYHSFAAIGDKKTQREIFTHLQGYYPASTRFVVLPMDMKYMGAGDVKQDLEPQLEELAKLKTEFGERILPFVFAHPERPNVLDIVKRYIEDHGFAGIKLYPPLGYYPFDQRLYPIYEYAQANGIPLISHCSRGGVFNKGRITKEMRKHPKTGAHLPEKSKNKFCENYTDPKNYTYVMNDFPNLKMCLAHFGGGDEWGKYLDGTHEHSAANDNWFSDICDLMQKYPSLYTDISYTHSETRLLPLLKMTLLTQKPAVSARVLFGTDFYMTEQEASEREHSIRLRTFLGEELFKRIAEDNPKQFLNL